MVRWDKPPVPSESEEQTALFQWAALMESRYPALKWMYHVPNEGKRSRATGARMKAEGLKPGVPDVCLPVPVGRFHGLYIEMKAGNNQPTKDQRDWLKALSDQGYCTAVCWGWRRAVAVITKYLGVKSYVC